MVLIVAKCIVNVNQNGQVISPVGVLIVAKCIVNDNFMIHYEVQRKVLIVAKCIVNTGSVGSAGGTWTVLIVAKCIVNNDFLCSLLQESNSINSSKVYCKYIQCNERKL